MRIPRFYIFQYLAIIAAVALIFAIVVGEPSQRGWLIFGLLFILGLAPALIPQASNSLESVLRNLPDAEGWLVRGRILEASHCYAEAVVAYKTALARPLLERKPVQEELSLRLAHAYARERQPQQRIDMSERLIQPEVSRSS